MTTDDNFVADAVADRIKQAMAVAGYDNALQREVAEKLGISPQSLNNILKARDLPTAKTAIMMCKIFKCDLEWLLTGRPPISKGTLQQAWNYATHEERRTLLKEIMDKASEKAYASNGD